MTMQMVNTNPQAILRKLPEREHAEFLRQYQKAVDGARQPAGYERLQHVLRLWHLTAVAASQPGYYESLESAQRGEARSVPMEEIIAARHGTSLAKAKAWWSDKLVEARRKMAR